MYIHQKTINYDISTTYFKKCVILYGITNLRVIISIMDVYLRSKSVYLVFTSIQRIVDYPDYVMPTVSKV